MALFLARDVHGRGTGSDHAAFSVSRCRCGRPGSVIGPVTCSRAGSVPTNSYAFTPVVLAALGLM
jgi:hypothetical protein